MLKKFPTTTHRPQGSNLVTRYGYLEYYWQSAHPQQPFGALIPFLPPQFATPTTRRNLFTCTLLCTLPVLYRPPSLFNFSLPPLPHSSRRLDPGQTRKSQLSEQPLALEPREVAWKISRFLNRSFPSCTASLKQLLRLDSHALLHAPPRILIQHSS